MGRQWFRLIFLYLAGAAGGFLAAYLAVYALAYTQMWRHMWVSKPASPVSYESSELPSVFAEHRGELKQVEEFYYKVKNWEFERVYYWAEMEDGPVYLCYVSNGYNRGMYVMEENFPFKELFESSMGRPGGRGEYACSIAVKGDLSQAVMSGRREIELEIENGNKRRVTFIFRPEGVPQSMQEKEIQTLGDGWYSSVQEWEVVY